MKTFVNHLHHQHAGRQEMYRGRLVDCHEVPDRLHHVLAELQRRPVGPLLVQQQLKAVLDAALAEARPHAQPGALEVRTGAFSLYPRSNRDGRISTWQGTAELVLSGTELDRIAALSGRIQGMTVAQTAFGLSREQREALEQQAQALAIERFRARAGEIARGFGFNTYSLREIHINSQDQGAQIRPRFMAMEAKAGISADAPLPVEAGQAQVQVTVSGAVQLK